MLAKDETRRQETGDQEADRGAAGGRRVEERGRGGGRKHGGNMVQGGRDVGEGRERKGGGDRDLEHSLDQPDMICAVMGFKGCFMRQLI